MALGTSLNKRMKEIIIEGLDVLELEIPEIKIFKSERKIDKRGYVLPVYNQKYLLSIGINDSFVHENHCWTDKRGTIRGFHYQLPPYGQSKLIRVTKGSILDVNVDIRRGSPTFGQHVKAELNPDDWNQIYVPTGFAHCYCTLEDDTEVIFKLGCKYAPDYAEGFAWNDPELNIDWPISEKKAIVLKRDMNRKRFVELTEFFHY